MTQSALALEAKPNGHGGQPFAIEAITYPVLAERIGELAAEYMVLRVAGVDDQDGMAVVRAARLNMKSLRVSVEKRRKELKAGALEYGRHVDDAARQLSDLLEPIETHLITQEEIVTHEKQRLAKIEADRIAARNLERLQQLTMCDTMMDMAQVAIMPDEQFAMILKAKQDAYAEKKRVESEEKAAREAEAARLRAERDELELQRAQQEQAAKIERDRLDKIRLEQAAAQKKIDAERRALAEAEGARLREAELEQARHDAANRARVETEQKIARGHEEADIRTKAAETARLKAESLKPDKAKLSAVADAVRHIEVPIVSSGAEVARAGIVKILAESAQKIHELAEKLGGEGIAPLFQ